MDYHARSRFLGQCGHKFEIWLLFQGITQKIFSKLPPLCGQGPDLSYMCIGGGGGGLGRPPPVTLTLKSGPPVPKCNKTGF
jgi:hypothetical protein